jgi:hypothetical protein
MIATRLSTTKAAEMKSDVLLITSREFSNAVVAVVQGQHVDDPRDDQGCQKYEPRKISG